MQIRNNISSPRLEELKRKRRQILRNKIIIFVFLLLILFVGFGLLSRWSKLNITNIEVIGNKVLDVEDIEKIVNEELSGNFLLIFPKTNFLFIPKKSLSNKLSSKFKRINDISIDLKNKDILQITISEIKAGYIWCGEDLSMFDNVASIEEININKCYFINDKGYIFAEAPYFSGDVYFKFFGLLTPNDKNIENSLNTNPIGQYFLPRIFSDIISFKENIVQLGFTPTSLFLKENGDIELYLLSNISPPNSPKIIFNKNSDFKKIIENLKASINTEPLLSNLKNKKDSLMYIDLKFGNKIYFKFK